MALKLAIGTPFFFHAFSTVASGVLLKSPIISIFSNYNGMPFQMKGLLFTHFGLFLVQISPDENTSKKFAPIFGKIFLSQIKIAST